MMDVVFFPFSHVDETQQNAMTAFFSHFLYLPLTQDLNEDPKMEKLAHKNAAVPVFTAGARLDRVASQVNAWLEWAKLHQGNERNLRALVRDNPYFTDDFGQAAIQSQLRSRMQNDLEKRDDHAGGGDPFLFLKIAGITDAKNEAVDQALAGLEKKQTFLFSQLKGESDPISPAAGKIPYRDPGEIMTLERIRAWAACAKEEKIFQRPGPLVLATTSRAVFDMVTANAAQAINALDIDSIKVHEDGCTKKPGWQDRVLGMLENLVTGPDIKDVKQIRSDLETFDDSCRITGLIQAGVFAGPDLEKKLHLPGRQLVVCRVTLKP